MTWQKRSLDIFLACVGILFFAIPFAVLFLFLMAVQGRPIFYLSERMKSPNEVFLLWKLRSMEMSAVNSGVTGGDKRARYTRYGKRLRRLRFDEIPQLWNVLKGDMSLVGPRPPLRLYVEDFPELYRQVLASRPGITGLATLTYHQHETEMLVKCSTAEQTDSVYRRRCIPQKARLDLIYQAHQSVCFDLEILTQTVGKVFSVRKPKARK
ncbi:sugar transferase [Falsihalocynthiibacter arcticus]|uniref:Sugar transferase n=1 Tax=Falsihalocynthiibacter arcticus TaxID=1579316 RepID=A0A126UXB5_9RHOB|nr:sugar transferase [Falsihalocynthiibacter arcticus]AML50680.1 sugar transferase [Falsihalocynthiibacter arcticus]